jgi:hypothetical protein
MDVTGVLKVKFDTQVVSEKFKKREFVLTITEGPSGYQQQVSFQLVQDRVSLMDSYNAGEEIKVHFNLRGREWVSPQNETKYFNTLEAWKIERAGNAVSASKPSANVSVEASMSKPGIENISSLNVSDDDLPF